MYKYVTLRHYRGSIPLPGTWHEVIALAKRGKLAVPAIPTDLLMSFYMFCLAHGNEPFLNEKEVIDDETGLKALDSMKELLSLVDKKKFVCNPIAIAELMTSTDDYWYCPFAYDRVPEESGISADFKDE